MSILLKWPILNRTFLIQLHSVSFFQLSYILVQQSKQREFSVKALCFPLTVQFLRHFISSGGTQYHTHSVYLEPMRSYQLSQHCTTMATINKFNKITRKESVALSSTPNVYKMGSAWGTKCLNARFSLQGRPVICGIQREFKTMKSKHKPFYVSFYNSQSCSVIFFNVFNEILNTHPHSIVPYKIPCCELMD